MVPIGSLNATPPANGLPDSGTVWQATQSAALVKYSPRASASADAGAPAIAGAAPAAPSVRFNATSAAARIAIKTTTIATKRFMIYALGSDPPPAGLSAATRL